MEFNEKLQTLRKQKGLTQEELAAALYVSRTAVSKWESGRGVPGIDSLKAISEYFSVSIDDLLSCKEILTIADKDGKQKERHIRDISFGMLDCSMIMLFILPLFAQRNSDPIKEVSVFMLNGTAPYITAAYITIISAMIVMGILTLAMQNCEAVFWTKNKYKFSLGINSAAALLFIITLQPYAAVFTFIFLAIKAVMLIKWQ